MRFPQTLHEAIRYFSTGDNAFNFMVSLRWPAGVVCPRCGASEVRFLKSRKIWECSECDEKRQFSVKVGTVMEDSPISLDKWLCAFWLIVNAKNGISSYEIARSLGLTQKTAWFLLHRIRLSMQSDSIEKFSGRVEADETYIGAKARFMHKHKRTGKTGMVGKTAVLGLLERGTEGSSRVRCRVLKRTRVSDLDPAIRANVEKGSEVMTDKLSSYYKLSDEYVHQVIDHAVSYAEGHVHTNGLENFWSLLKRGIRGTYVNVEPFHLFRYLDEQAFRFNERKDNDAGRFVKAVAGVIGKGLRYANLTGKKGGDGLPPQTAGTWQTA
jgi:transposase-like protein